MKNSFLIILLLSVVLGASAQKDEVKIIEINYGSYTAVKLRTYKNPSTANNKSTTSRNFKFAKNTDTIILKKGAKFGLYYRLISDIEGELPIEVEWKYPRAMVGLDKKKYRFHRSYDKERSGASSNIGYIIEDDLEMLPGIWRLRLYYGNKKLYERKFYLKVPKE